MSTSNDDLDARLKKAFTPDTQTTAGDTVIDPDTLQARRVTLVNPKARRATALAGATGALATIAAVAVVTTSVFGPQEPLFTLAGGMGGEGAALSAESADTRIAQWVEYRYVAGESLSKDSGRGEVYQLVLTGTPESVLTDVGQVFGITGDINESLYFDPAYPSYVIGSREWDGGPSVTINWMGTGSWWYSDPAAYPEPDCPEVDPNTEPDSDGDPDRVIEESDIIECVYTAPTGSFPSEAEAKRLAADIFSQTGFPVEANDVRVLYADEWGMSLAASLTVAGEETAIEWALGIAPGGIISYASGHSITVENRGEFDTISAYDAVERLEDGNWWGSPGPEFYDNQPMIAEARLAEDTTDTNTSDTNTDTSTDPSTDTPVSDTDSNDGEMSEGSGTDPETPTDTSSDPTEPTEPTPDTPVDSGEVIEPLPGDDVPIQTEPEVVEVTVTSAKDALLLVYDQSGGAWFVPGFVMVHDQGWWVSVISLIEGVIQMPEPMDYDIMPLPEPYIEPEVSIDP